MRGKISLEDAEEVIETVVKPFGKGAKINSNKRHIGKRATVIIHK